MQSLTLAKVPLSVPEKKGEARRGPGGKADKKINYQFKKK